MIMLLYEIVVKCKSDQRLLSKLCHTNDGADRAVKHLSVLSVLTSGWTLLFLVQQQPWCNLKPQQVGDVPSSLIAHLPHAASTQPSSAAHLRLWTPFPARDCVVTQEIRDQVRHSVGQ